MITVLIITNALTFLCLFFVGYRYQAQIKYNRKINQERIALAIEVGELREDKEFISFGVSLKEPGLN